MKPDQATLLRLFSYDPNTGELRRRVAASRSPVGKIPGSINHQGYRCIGINGARYLAPSLIWVMMTGQWPDQIVDHIDTYGPKADWGDRWENLRLATKAENGQNRRTGTNNKSGYMGVSWWSRDKRWCAQIKVNRKRMYLGVFRNKEDAILARQIAENTFFGTFRPMGGNSGSTPLGGLPDRQDVAQARKRVK